MTRTLLGLAFANMTVREAAGMIAARPADAPFAYVVTPNADHLVRVSRDSGLHEIYRKSTLCLLDSRVVSGLAHILGLKPPPVVTGCDLTARILADHILPKERLTIIGLPSAALLKLRDRYNLAEPAHFDPPMGFDRDPALFAEAVAFVLAHPARLIFLAVGSPRQERLAAAIAATGAATGTGLCIGASLAFASGAQRRAPVAFQRAGLEWLFRLACNPRRLARRYLLDSPPIIGLMLRQRLGRGRGGSVPRARYGQ